MRSSDSFRLVTSWLFLPRGDVCDLLSVAPDDQGKPESTTSGSDR